MANVIHRVQFQLVGSIPPFVNSSYGGMKFYKFGVFRFLYDVGVGPVHFLNFDGQVAEPEFINSTGVELWTYPGVFFKVNRIPVVQGKDISDVLVNGVPTNPVTGKNMPLVLP